MLNYLIGDMIKELKDPNLDPSRESEIIRLLNEQGQRNEVLAKWIGPDGKPFLTSSTIFNPLFLSYALSPMSLSRSTDIAITTGVDTPVIYQDFDKAGDSFKFDLQEPTKIRLAYTGQGFGILGKVGWEANATGERVVKIEAFDISGASLGSDVLCSYPGFAAAANVYPFQLLVPQNQFPTMDYFVLNVRHGRGANLNLTSFGVTVFIT